MDNGQMERNNQSVVNGSKLAGLVKLLIAGLFVYIHFNNNNEIHTISYWINVSLDGFFTGVFSQMAITEFKRAAAQDRTLKILLADKLYGKS